MTDISKEKNTISIAMATYNGEHFIERQLLSLLKQTYPPDEIVICDDCSSDETVSIIQRYVKEDNRIHLFINDENLGYRQNFKKAVSLTKGDYIFLCDQDDEWHLDKIEKMVHLMNKEKCTALCTDYRLINEQSDLLEKDNYQIHPFISNSKPDGLRRISFNRLIFGNILQGCTYCFTKEVKERYLELENGEVVHDQQIMFISSLLGTVLFFNKPLIDYRLHSANAIGIADKNKVERIHFDRLSGKPFMVDFLEKLNQVVPVKHKHFYYTLYYLRIPYLVSKIRGFRIKHFEKG